MPTFCTISTTSHLFKAFALADSIAAYGYDLHVLVVDETFKDAVPGNVILHDLQELTDEMSRKLIAKYQGNKDKLRWAMKPCFLNKLLLSETKVIYVDNDVLFYNDPGFLFDLLDTDKVLLTPHFYHSDPSKEQNWLEANFRVGLYNAGFIGVNQHAYAMLQWWAGCCLYNIKKSFWRGLFDDQKYLDLVPVIFDEVKIVKHKGCNLAGWNYAAYSIIETAEIANNLVFVHFADLTMKAFSEPGCAFNPIYNQYISALKRYKPAYRFEKPSIKAYHFMSYFYYVKWRILRCFNR